MEDLLPEFEKAFSLIHPTCYATTSHLLEQRQYLAKQPLVFEFDGVWEDDMEDLLEDQEINNSFNIDLKNKRRYSSEFIFHPINNNNNNNNNNNIQTITPIATTNNTSSILKPSLSPLPRFQPITTIKEEEDNLNNNTDNNNSSTIDKIKNRFEKLDNQCHIKIPKVKTATTTSNFQQKRKSFTNDKKFISISKTMKKNVFNCLTINGNF